MIVTRNYEYRKKPLVCGYTGNKFLSKHEYLEHLLNLAIDKRVANHDTSTIKDVLTSFDTYYHNEINYTKLYNTLLVHSAAIVTTSWHKPNIAYSLLTSGTCSLSIAKTTNDMIFIKKCHNNIFFNNWQVGIGDITIKSKGKLRVTFYAKDERNLYIGISNDLMPKLRETIDNIKVMNKLKR